MLAAITDAVNTNTGATMNLDIVAPKNAPAHMVTTTPMRKFWRSPVPRSEERRVG